MTMPKRKAPIDVTSKSIFFPLEIRVLILRNENIEDPRLSQIRDRHAGEGTSGLVEHSVIVIGKSAIPQGQTRSVTRMTHFDRLSMLKEAV